MEKKLLKVGDVFKVKSGWNVQTSIPEKFVYSNRSQSSNLTNSIIEVNHHYPAINDDNLIDTMVEDIIEVFIDKGIDIKYKTALDFVNKITENNSLNSDEKFVFKPGEFIVVDAKLTGGGTGHGPNDIYPDGWEITAKRLKDGQYDENEEEIKFFQSGSFAHLINENIPVLRTMKKETKFV